MTATATQNGMTKEQKALLKKTICSDVHDQDFELFCQTCETTGLDPFSRQIYPVTRFDKRQNRKVSRPESTIDGFRVIAERQGQYAGQLGPFWCGKDGQWRDVWLEDKPPAAAKVGIMRNDFQEPLWAVATWDQYVQKTNDGKVSGLWVKMGPLMLSKCAEALALRRAFPNNLSGLYTREEMQQADPATEPPEQQEADAKPAESPSKAVEQAMADDPGEQEAAETASEAKEEKASKEPPEDVVPTKKHLIETLGGRGLTTKQIKDRCQVYFDKHCEGKKKFDDLTDSQKVALIERAEEGLLDKDPDPDVGFIPF